MIDTDQRPICPHCWSVDTIGALDEYGDPCCECCDCGAQWYDEEIQ